MAQNPAAPTPPTACQAADVGVHKDFAWAPPDPINKKPLL